MKNMSFVIGAICLAFVLWIAIDPPTVTAAVEDTSWGEVKSQQQQAYRAAKAAHHARINGRSPGEEDIVGEWESRRFNEETHLLEEVHYLFQSDGSVTLTQVIVDSLGGQPGPPLVGRWQLIEEGTLFINWEGTLESTWIDVTVYSSEDEELFVLDYKDSRDKELRTLDQAASLPPPRNWLVTMDPDDQETYIKKGQWMGFDFELRAADRHLPDFVRVRVESRSDPSFIFLLDKRAYNGQDEPQVDLCYDGDGGFPLPGNRTPTRWSAESDLFIALQDRTRDKGSFGFYATGCEIGIADVKIFSPDAAVDTDDPLKTFRVRIGAD